MSLFLFNEVSILSSSSIYQCEINEDVVLSTAKQMVALGLKDAGYNYVNIDDCYSSKNRTEHGDIIEDPVNFKSGMRNLTDQLHDLGLYVWFNSATSMTYLILE